MSATVSVLPIRREPEEASDDAARRWIKNIADVCEEIARGNLEARVMGCEESGDIGRAVGALNHMLDITDAFVREAKASLDYASRGKFFRRVLLRGLPGTYRHAAGLINEATAKMEGQALALKESERKRQALADEFEGTVQELVATLASSATEMQATAEVLVRNAGATADQATAVAAAAEETSTSVQTVASAAEELAASASEIGRRVGESKHAADEAVQGVERTTGVVSDLAKASSQTGQVVKLISDVAKQTNLLALNATIEAARAGEAGAGFAVVASEVKNLARQTSNATDDIEGRISAIQSSTREGVEAIASIEKTIRTLATVANNIAESVDEQRLATSQIGENVHQAALGTKEVSHNIALVSRAIAETGEAAGAMLTTATDLSRQAEALLAAAKRFADEVRGK